MDLEEIFRTQKSFALYARLSHVRERRQNLRRLLHLVLENQDRIIEANARDFGKPAAETLMTELLLIAHEIRFALKNLDDWTRSRRVPSGPWLLGSSCEIRREPRGVCLIISPWNYPWQLSLSPLVAALAAGNSVILKPSELTPHGSALLQDLLHAAFPRELIAVATGDADTAKQLLAMPFDHIFFTGSTRVGREVMQAAAKNLASVTLELGGKSPVIVHGNADLEWTASRLIWGKWVNAGQTCVAPDTLYVERGLWPALREKLSAHLQRQSADSLRDLSRIVSDRHWRRLQEMSEQARDRGWRIALEGGLAADPATRAFPLQVYQLQDPGLAATTTLATEEIFGPILPVILYDRLEEVLDRLNREEKPLALYIFNRNSDVQEKILRATSSGGVVINDVMAHLANSFLPFGGVGNSGYGSYHGEHGFRAFSHEKAVVRQGALRALFRWLEPPYSNAKLNLLRRALRLPLA